MWCWLQPASSMETHNLITILHCMKWTNRNGSIAKVQSMCMPYWNCYKVYSYCSGIMHHQKHLRDLLLHIQMKRRISDFVCHNSRQSKTTSCAVPSPSPEKTNILSSLSRCRRGSVGHLWTLNFSGGIISSFWWRVTPSSNYLTVKK